MGANEIGWNREVESVWEFERERENGKMRQTDS